jgi:hypothetical protein
LFAEHAHRVWIGQTVNTMRDAVVTQEDSLAKRNEALRKADWEGARRLFAKALEWQESPEATVRSSIRYLLVPGPRSSKTYAQRLAGEEGDHDPRRARRCL